MWSFAESVKDGCVPGNCSYRPSREEKAAFDEPVVTLSGPFVPNVALIRESLAARTPVGSDGIRVLETEPYCDVCGRAGADLRTSVEVCRDCYDFARNPPPGCRPPIDWDAMTTEKVLAALRSAPKVAGAWVAMVDSYRRDLCPKQRYAPAVWLFDYSAYKWRGNFEEFVVLDVSLDEAKAAVDAELIRRGWRLL